VCLRARPANPRGAELLVQGRDPIRVRNVLIGDVWLCGGQSNMAFTVARGLNAEAEIGAADFPVIRQFLVPRRVAEEPREQMAGSWQACRPDTVADFSGVAYFFARDLDLRNRVPVGLVNATWGGTQVEAWMSADALRADPSFAAIERRWQDRLAGHHAQEQEDQRRWMPAGPYNAMIAPLIPMPFRGVILYQGEANAPRAAEYASLFQGLIRQWRDDFGDAMPFYFVQLANHDRKSDPTRRTWASLREAQQAALALPHTGMVVTIDIGDVADVHPKNKQEVGRRLALLVRRDLEGEPVAATGPPRLGERMYTMVAEILLAEVAGLVATAPEVEPASDTILWHSLCDYLSAHWSDPTLSRETTAKFFNRHSNSISRFFHKHSRRNFRAYLNEIRLKRSIQFLGDLRYNVTDVAGLCGVTDPQYFIRCFRKRFGITPGDYRRRRKP